MVSARPAAASDPFTTYVVPSLVELQPTEAAATRVVIHGAFFHLTSATAFAYSDARCGVMYFQCAAGQEVMCRMQWNELKAAISPAPTMCRGFGNKMVVSTATVYAEGQPLGTPDPWDLGMGIGLGSSVDNKCPPATALSCPATTSRDGGAPDAPAGTGGAGGARGTGGAQAGSGGAPGTGGASGTGGAAAGSGGATAGSGGAPGTGGATATGGAQGTGGSATGGMSAKPPARSNGGCTIAGGTSRSGAPATMAVVATLATLLGGVLLAGARTRRRLR